MCKPGKYLLNIGNSFGGGLGRHHDHSNTIRAGFNSEMYNFDGIDWFLPKYNDKKNIINSYNERLKRLKLIILRVLSIIFTIVFDRNTIGN